MDTAAPQQTLDNARSRLLDCRNEAGYWEPTPGAGASTMSSLELTCRAIRALAACEVENKPNKPNSAAVNLEALRHFILRQQENTQTPAAKGRGWSGSGGASNSWNTAIALLALRDLGPVDAPGAQAAAAGLSWLMQRQDSDGGVPMLPPRGWWPTRNHERPPAVAAQALQAGLAWLDLTPPDHAPRLRHFCGGCLTFLAANQRQDGGWTGHADPEKVRSQESNFAGTITVLNALEAAATAAPQDAGIKRLHKGGVYFLTSRQREDGTWSDADHDSITATAWAVGTLANHLHDLGIETGPAVRTARARGLDWLLVQTQEGTKFETGGPAAISATIEAVGKILNDGDNMDARHGATTPR